MAFDNLVLQKIVKVLATVLDKAYLEVPYALGENQYAVPFHGSKALLKTNNGRGTLILYLDAKTPFVTYATDRFTKTNDNTPFFNALKKLVGTQVISILKEKGERVLAIETKNIGKGLGDLNDGFTLILELFPSRPNVFLIPKPYNKITGLFREYGDITSPRYLTRNIPYKYPPERQEFTKKVKTLTEAKGLLANEVYKLLAARTETVGFIKARDELLADCRLYYRRGIVLPASFNLPEASKIEVAEIYAKYVNNQKVLAKTLREKDLVNRLKTANKTVERKLSNLVEDQKEAQHRLVYKDWGNLLFLYQTQYKPGLKEMTLEGVQIPLNPQKGIIENANQYFKSYRKAKQAVVTLQELYRKTLDEAAYLNKKLQEVLLADNRDLQELKEELVLEGYLKNPSRKGKKPKRRRVYAPHIMPGPQQSRIGFGLNDLQNETLTFKVANANDLFFHIKDYPGAHVVILDGKKGKPEQLLAAELALYLAAKDSGEVMVAEKRDVKKNSGRLGLVNIRKYSSIVIKQIRPSSVDLFDKALKG